MARSPKLTATKKTALTLLLVSLMAPDILKIQLIKAAPKTNTFDINSAVTQLPEWTSPSTSPSPSPSASPSPTATPPPTDMKPLPTTLFVAVAILACVFGFGLIVNLLTGKKRKN
jgi:hypothetical protein